MRPAWADACEKVALKGLLFHDLPVFRRGPYSESRSEATAMKVFGHRTRAVFNRYNIIDGKDIKDAGKKVAEFLKGAGVIFARERQ